MKNKLLLLFLLPLTLSCNSQSVKVKEISNNIVFQPRDKEILEEIFKEFGSDKKLITADLIVKVGTYFLETPYVGHTLEGDTEKLVVNLRELDCTTFAENCLAISKTIRSGELTFDHFAKELRNMRYREGNINGYTSRIHYFSDWIYTNDKGKLISNVSQEIGQTPYPLTINYMSSHPKSYKQLSDNPELIPVIIDQEKIISQRTMFYIPESRIAEVETKLQDGDIVGITTTIAGMDISHVVILVRREGRIHILHASSMAEKVILSEETLEGYLLNSKSATGIMVARPL